MGAASNLGKTARPSAEVALRQTARFAVNQGMDTDKDGRSAANPGNGAQGGAPHHQYPSDAVIDATAHAILTGRRSPLTIADGTPVSQEAKRHIRALTGISAEEFTAELTARLQPIARRTCDRIMEKLEADLYKPDGLSYLMGVTVDKLSILGGRTATTQNVNVQINNFGSQAVESRSAVLDRLHGLQGEKEKRVS